MNSDFKDLLRAFNANGVKYLVVGGYAVIEYTEPRFTKDLDVWVGTNRANAEMVFKALTEFGAPLQDVSVEDSTNGDNIYQIGISPVRIDVIMEIPGVFFDEAFERRNESDFEGVTAHVISREDLITNKLAVGRAQDRKDARLLTQASGITPTPSKRSVSPRKRKP